MHWDDRCLGRGQLEVRLDLFVSWVNELEVEVIHGKGQSEAGEYFCECLAKTDTSAAEEWAEREWVPLLAIWSEVHLRVGVETLRIKNVRIFPLFRVFVDWFKVDTHR
jgi:hypothetical protein